LNAVSALASALGTVPPIAVAATGGAPSRPPSAERLRAQQRALAALTRSAVFQGDDLQATLHHITETAARVLGCERVSLSRYTEARDAIRCIDLYELSPDRHSSGFELETARYPRYFAALASSEAIDADDAHADPRTAEFSACGYLQRFGIGAMLDIPLHLYGVLEGVLCFEQVGEPLCWTDEDRLFGRAVTNLIALAIEHSERRRAEAALRASQQRLATLVAYAPDAIVVLDVDTGRCVEANEQAARLCGRARSELLAIDLGSVTPERQPDGHLSAQRGREKLDEALAGGAPVFEWTVLHASGRPVACEVRLVGLPDPERRLIRGSLVDISERKRAESRLAESAERIGNILAQAPDAFISIDADGRVTEWNRQAEATFGWLRDEVLGRDLAELLIPPRHRERHREGMRRFAATGAGAVLDAHVELSALHRDGHEIPVEISIAALAGRAGYSANAFLRDISERHAAQEALRRSEQRLAAMLAHAPEAVVVLDADTLRFVEATASAARLFGCRREALLTMGPVELSPARQPDGRDSRAAALAAVEQALDGQLVVFEWTHLLGDGQPLACEVRLVRLPDPQRRLVRGSIVDITERVRTQAELRAAKDLAEAANRAKSEFLASMSHELRTPLNSVLGYAQLLRSQAGFGTAQEHALGVIQQSGEHLLGLIDEILDMAKIEAGTLELTLDGFDLHALFDSLGPGMSRRAEREGLSFACVGVDALPALVSGDERRLRQVLTNLLDNAIKYTERGGIELRVCRHEGRTRFAVEDSGIGIPPSQLGRVFEVFHQVREGDRTRDGTGLGLAICKRLVALMGGELRVDSTPGAGSRFWFDIDLPPAAGTAARVPPPRVTRVDGARQRLLVIDDNDDSRALLRAQLEPHGFELHEARDGESGIDAARRARPDLVLVDLRMPGLDGLQVMRRLRALPELSGVKVIAISASAFDVDRQHCLAAGADDFLGKPFRQHKLLELLSRHLGLALGYADDAVAAEAKPERLVAPPNDLAELRELARRGDVKGLTMQGERLAADHPAFAAQLRALAGACELKKLRRWLDGFGAEHA
jgi:PAS domain S-box-containing protein